MNSSALLEEYRSVVKLSREMVNISRLTSINPISMPRGMQGPGLHICAHGNIIHKNQTATDRGIAKQNMGSIYKGAFHLRSQAGMKSYHTTV